MELVAILNQIIEMFIKAFATKNALSEEQVCRTIIEGIIRRVWMFDYGFGDVGSFETEVETQVGHDRILKPDYVLHCAGGKEIIIEAKATTEQLDNWVEQLASEVNVRSAAVGILWNGTELRLYLRGANGMEKEAYRTIKVLDRNADDINFILSLFDPKHTINDAQMKRDQKVRREQEEERAKHELFNNSFCDFWLNMPDDVLNRFIRQVENKQSVQKGTTDKYRQEFLPVAQNVLKDRLAAKEIANYKLEQAKANRLEPEEAAIGTLARGFMLTKNRKVSFTDEGDARRSRVTNDENGRPILWIIGNVTEDGYKFKGIAFPNRKRGIGEIIQINDFLDLQTVYGETLVGVYDHINEPDWETFYDATFGG